MFANAPRVVLFEYIAHAQDRAPEKVIFVERIRYTSILVKHLERKRAGGEILRKLEFKHSVPLRVCGVVHGNGAPDFKHVPELPFCKKYLAVRIRLSKRVCASQARRRFHAQQQ